MTKKNVSANEKYGIDSSNLKDELKNNENPKKNSRKKTLSSNNEHEVSEKKIKDSAAAKKNSSGGDEDKKIDKNDSKKKSPVKNSKKDSSSHESKIDDESVSSIKKSVKKKSGKENSAENDYENDLQKDYEKNNIDKSDSSQEKHDISLNKEDKSVKVKKVVKSSADNTAKAEDDSQAQNQQNKEDAVPSKRKKLTMIENKNFEENEQINEDYNDSEKKDQSSPAANGKNRGPRSNFHKQSPLNGFIALNEVRIAKKLADLGIASRREAEIMILQGKVKINDQIITDLSTLVSYEDNLMVNDKKINNKPEELKVYIFNKPAGYITSTSDPEGRKTVFDIIPKHIGKVKTIGRLDYNSAGLILLTNNGDYAYYMEKPENRIRREYRIRVFGDVDMTKLKELEKGIEIEDVSYGKIIVEPENIIIGGNSWLKVVLYEGKNREIRKVMNHFNLEVSQLIRVGYGKYRLGNIPQGCLAEVMLEDAEEENSDNNQSDNRNDSYANNDRPPRKFSDRGERSGNRERSNDRGGDRNRFNSRDSGPRRSFDGGSRNGGDRNRNFNGNREERPRKSFGGDRGSFSSDRGSFGSSGRGGDRGNFSRGGEGRSNSFSGERRSSSYSSRGGSTSSLENSAYSPRKFGEKREFGPRRDGFGDRSSNFRSNDLSRPQRYFSKSRSQNDGARGDLTDQSNIFRETKWGEKSSFSNFPSARYDKNENRNNFNRGGPSRGGFSGGTSRRDFSGGDSKRDSGRDFGGSSRSFGSSRFNKEGSNSESSFKKPFTPRDNSSRSFSSNSYGKPRSASSRPDSRGFGAKPYNSSPRNYNTGNKPEYSTSHKPEEDNKKDE